MATEQLTIIIPAAKVELAREIAAALSNGGVGMFPRGAAPGGLEPATLYLSAGPIGAEFAALLGNAALLHLVATRMAALRGMPMTATLADCEELVTTADVSDDAPAVALARHGAIVILLPEERPE